MNSEDYLIKYLAVEVLYDCYDNEILSNVLLDSYTDEAYCRGIWAKTSAVLKKPSEKLKAFYKEKYQYLDEFEKAVCPEEL